MQNSWHLLHRFYSTMTMTCWITRSATMYVLGHKALFVLPQPIPLMKWTASPASRDCRNELLATKELRAHLQASATPLQPLPLCFSHSPSGDSGVNMGRLEAPHLAPNSPRREKDEELRAHMQQQHSSGVLPCKVVPIVNRLQQCGCCALLHKVGPSVNNSSSAVMCCHSGSGLQTTKTRLLEAREEYSEMRARRRDADH